MMCLHFTLIPQRNPVTNYQPDAYLVVYSVTSKSSFATAKEFLQVTARSLSCPRSCTVFSEILIIYNNRNHYVFTISLTDFISYLCGDCRPSANGTIWQLAPLFWSQTRQTSWDSERSQLMVCYPPSNRAGDLEVQYEEDWIICLKYIISENFSIFTSAVNLRGTELRKQRRH